MLLESKKLYSFGTNSLGQLGLKSVDQKKYVPSLIEFGTELIVNISCGRDHALALTKKGIVYSWGCNNDGQLGLGHLNSKNYPVAIDPKLFVCKSIASGWCHSIILTMDETIYSFGLNSSGQLGIATLSMSSSPQFVAKESNIKEIYCGNCHVLTMNGNGIIKVWGYNGYGQLGLGDIISRNIPIPLDTKIKFSFPCGDFIPFKKGKQNSFRKYLKKLVLKSTSYELLRSWFKTICPKLIEFETEIFKKNAISLEVIYQYLCGFKSFSLLKECKDNYTIIDTIYYSEKLELLHLKDLLKDLLLKKMQDSWDKKKEQNETSLIIKYLLYSCETKNEFTKTSILKFFLDNNIEPETKIMDDLPREIERIFMGKNKLGEINPLSISKIDPFEDNIKKFYETTNKDVEIIFKSNDGTSKIMIDSLVLYRSPFFSKQQIENGKMKLDLKMNLFTIQQFIHFLYFDKTSTLFINITAMEIMENENALIEGFPELEEECFKNSSEPTIDNCLIYLTKFLDNSKDKRFDKFFQFAIDNYQIIFKMPEYQKLDLNLRTRIQGERLYILFELLKQTKKQD